MYHYLVTIGGLIIRVQANNKENAEIIARNYFKEEKFSAVMFGNNQAVILNLDIVKLIGQIGL